MTFFDFFQLPLSESSSVDLTSFGLFSIRTDVADVVGKLIVSCKGNLSLHKRAIRKERVEPKEEEAQEKEAMTKI